jgi:hypothetical protein
MSCYQPALARPAVQCLHCFELPSSQDALRCCGIAGMGYPGMGMGMGGMGMGYPGQAPGMMPGMMMPGMMPGMGMPGG